MNSNSPVDSIRRRFQSTQAQLDEKKRRARELLEQLGVPTQPPPAQPVPRVRVRVLQERTYPGGGGRTRTVRVGDELVTEEANLQSLVESGFAELIGPAPPRPAPEPRAFGEIGEAPYVYWCIDVADGKHPAEWKEWGIELPPEEERAILVEALWNAALVYSADFETSLAADAAFRAYRGSPTVPPDEALHWPMETLHMLSESFSPEELIARRHKTRQDARKAGSAAKHARGIQVAVDQVYSEGMTEREAWEALLALLDDEFETEDGKYELYVDSAEDKGAVVVQRDFDTGRERSITRSSFWPYFVRARDPHSP